MSSVQFELSLSLLFDQTVSFTTQFFIHTLIVFNFGHRQESMHSTCFWPQLHSDIYINKSVLSGALINEGAIKSTVELGNFSLNSRRFYQQFSQLQNYCITEVLFMHLVEIPDKNIEMIPGKMKESYIQKSDFRQYVKR